jgi:hypothetical protein
VQHLADGISDGAMPLSHIVVSGAGLPRGRPGPAGRSRAVACALLVSCAANSFLTIPGLLAPGRVPAPRLRPG